MPFEAPSCTACGATERTKAGTKGGKQVYRCKSCNRRYVHTAPGFQKNKYPPNVVAGSLNMLMSGVSYRKVAENASCCFGMRVSHHHTLLGEKVHRADQRISGRAEGLC